MSRDANQVIKEVVDQHYGEGRVNARVLSAAFKQGGEEALGQALFEKVHSERSVRRTMQDLRRAIRAPEPLF